MNETGAMLNSFETSSKLVHGGPQKGTNCMAVASLLTLCSALLWVDSGNTKEGSITVPLTSSLTGLD